MDNADVEVLPLLVITWLGGTTVMVFVKAAGRNALMGLASAHAQLRWLRTPDFLAPPAAAAAAPSAAES
ncbi:unnamed protein product [Urochloa decumbens]|uniref:Uncharacterized protein n=1 Tax=Urochloa decumbens TaxID=240449 RepID=A0ABC9BSE1_9POAL